MTVPDKSERKGRAEGQRVRSGLKNRQKRYTLFFPQRRAPLAVHEPSLLFRPHFLPLRVKPLCSREDDIILSFEANRGPSHFALPPRC